MNTIEILLVRNPSKDYIEKDISYFGFDFLHPDKSPANLNFSHFCNVGVRTIFGKDTKLENKNYKVLLHLIPVNESDPYTVVPNSVRSRRLFMIKENNIVKMFFRTGIPTNMSFDENDETCVLNWINFSSLPENTKIWIDFAATILDNN